MVFKAHEIYLKMPLPEVTESKLALPTPVSRPHQRIHLLKRDVHVHVEILGQFFKL